MEQTTKLQNKLDQINLEIDSAESVNKIQGENMVCMELKFKSSLKPNDLGYIDEFSLAEQDKSLPIDRNAVKEIKMKIKVYSTYNKTL